MKRFDDKIEYTDTCWLWRAGKDRWGYGQFRYKGKTRSAHRIAYKLYVGEIPEGMFVLHKCDNPICVNPKHLFLGTLKDNSQDMVKKGRNNTGKGSAKLTKEEVVQIRKSPESGVILAKMFRVTPSNISLVRNRKSWVTVY